MVEIIFIKVDHAHKSASDLAVCLCSFKINEAFVAVYQHVLQVFFHFGIDKRNSFFCLVKIDLGESYTQS